MSLYPSRLIELVPLNNEHCKRLKDPLEDSLFHMEAWLPFSEAVKLERGNANVRPSSERKKPFRDMTETVENDPRSFHLKNRGITYLCERFEFDNSSRRLRLTIPSVSPDEYEETEGLPRFGIADGGHTYEVIRQTMDHYHELKERESWIEPFVRVHFLAGAGIDAAEVEQVVEALNTSSQVQQYTLDEYQNKFNELKDALRATGFDVEQVAFRENEEKEWDVREILQRMACFLKDRWKTTPPASIYRSKGKALDLFTNESTRDEFRKLYPVIADIVTFPEFIESEFSRGDVSKGKKLGKLRAAKTLKKTKVRPATSFQTDHEMDLAATLPLAAAFRELLDVKDGQYYWKVQPHEAFHRCADELYRILLAKSRTAKTVAAIGSDTEYWTQASNVLLRTKDEMLAGQ